MQPMYWPKMHFIVTSTGFGRKAFLSQRKNLDDRVPPLPHLNQIYF